MTSSRESSVLFALDELRDIEEIRKRDQREVARKQARERARVLEAERSKREAAAREAEREASELSKLQVKLEDDARSRRVLEAQLAADAQINESLKSRLRILEAGASQPGVEHLAQDKTNRIHATWAFALIATLGAFLLFLSQRDTPPPVIVSTAPAPVIAPADCPEPQATPVAEPALVPATDASPTNHVRPRRVVNPKVKDKPPTSQPIDISGCADDPLGCMPE